MNTNTIHINGRDDWHPDDYAAARASNGDVWGEYDGSSITLEDMEAQRANVAQAALLFELINTSRGGMLFIDAVDSWRSYFKTLEAGQ